MDTAMYTNSLLSGSGAEGAAITGFSPCHVIFDECGIKHKVKSQTIHKIGLMRSPYVIKYVAGVLFGVLDWTHSVHALSFRHGIDKVTSIFKLQESATSAHSKVMLTGYLRFEIRDEFSPSKVQRHAQYPYALTELSFKSESLKQQFVPRSGRLCQMIRSLYLRGNSSIPSRRGILHLHNCLIW